MSPRWTGWNSDTCPGKRATTFSCSQERPHHLHIPLVATETCECLGTWHPTPGVLCSSIVHTYLGWSGYQVTFHQIDTVHRICCLQWEKCEIRHSQRSSPFIPPTAETLCAEWVTLTFQWLHSLGRLAVRGGKSKAQGYTECFIVYLQSMLGVGMACSLSHQLHSCWRVGALHGTMHYSPIG